MHHRQVAAINGDLLTVTNDKEKMNETKNGELEMEKENQILFFIKFGVKEQTANMVLSA